MNTKNPAHEYSINREYSGLLEWLNRKTIFPYALVTPIFICLLVVLVYPWVWTFVLSFQEWSPIRPGPPQFVGLQNYVRFITNSDFIQSLQITLYFTFTVVVLQFILGFALALLLDTRVRSRKIFLTLCITPMIIAPAVTGIIWRILLHYEMGIVNYYLRVLGFSRINFLGHPDWALTTAIFIEIWQNTPFIILVMLAGLQSIPKELYEAGSIDGASWFQRFRFITLPNLAGLITIIIMFRTIWALRSFDRIWALFQSGGPGNAARVWGVYLYEYLRVTWQLGRASALVYIMLWSTIAISSVLILKVYKGAEE